MKIAPLIWTIALMLSFSASFAAEETTPNLVANPGFEDGMAPWAENNWLRNEARFTRDQSNPHSGRYSYKIQFTKVVNGSIVQWLYPSLAVKSGQTLRLSYWARGISNGPALHLLMRKGSEPYTVYFRSEAIPTEEWQEFVSTVTLPEKLDTDTLQLAFQLRGVGTVWIDDVSVTEMPPVEAGEPPQANPIRNASFEVGQDGWIACFRQREFGTLWEESGANYPSPEGARLESVEATDAPQGRRYLAFTLPESSRVVLTSAYFPARYGHPMTLKFSLKSSVRAGFRASIVSGKNGNARNEGGTSLRATESWQAFTVPVTLKPAPSGLYCASFEFLQPGRYEIDAVSLTENEQLNVPLFLPALSLVQEENGPVAHLYRFNEEGRFQVKAAALSGEKNWSGIVAVIDYLGHTLSRLPVTLPLDDKGYGQASVRVPTSRFGTFKLELRQSPPVSEKSASWWQRLTGGEESSAKATAAIATTGPLLAEELYSVLPDLPPPAERPDSYFGAHVDFTSYNLEIARRAGFRWLRLYPPLMTQWMAAEPKPGEWHFPTEALTRAHAQGFRILASLCTAPEFASDLDPKAEKTRWVRSFPPADMNRWKEYVTRCFNAYHDYVAAWEVWNEPDGGYLRVRPGVDKTEIYFSLLKSAREALDATSKPYFLTGPAISAVSAPLGWELLEKGGGNYLDAYSFHFYSLAAGGNNPDIDFLETSLQRYAGYRGKDQQPLELWHTEGGAYLAGSQSWLQTYRIPPSSSVTPPQAAASMVRAALYFKAKGVKRHFAYQAGASEAGRRAPEDITCGYIDVTGIPSPGLAAHAAMVSLTEDLAGAGFETKTIDLARVRVAHFASGKQRVDVYWADGTIGLSKLIDHSSPCEVFDLMGNRIAFNEAQIGEYPVYVRSNRSAN